MCALVSVCAFVRARSLAGVCERVRECVCVYACMCVCKRLSEWIPMFVKTKVPTVRHVFDYVM